MVFGTNKVHTCKCLMFIYYQKAIFIYEGIRLRFFVIKLNYK